jgi:hypothetical protein
VLPLLFTDRRELVDSRFCKPGVDSRRSSLNDVVLGAFRRPAGFEGTAGVETCRNWGWALSKATDGDSEGEELGGNVPIALKWPGNTLALFVGADKSPLRAAVEYPGEWEAC